MFFCQIKNANSPPKIIKFNYLMYYIKECDVNIIIKEAIKQNPYSIKYDDFYVKESIIFALKQKPDNVISRIEKLEQSLDKIETEGKK